MAEEASTNESQSPEEASGASETSGASSEQTSSAADLRALMEKQAETIRKLESNNERLSNEDAKRRKKIEEKQAQHLRELEEMGEFKSVAEEQKSTIEKLQEQIAQLEQGRPKVEAYDKIIAETEARIEKDMKRLDKEDRETAELIPDTFSRARFVERLLSKKTEGKANLGGAAAGNGSSMTKDYNAMSQEEKRQHLDTLFSGGSAH